MKPRRSQPVTVGELRHATANAQPGLVPVVYDERGQQLAVEEVFIEHQNKKPRLVMRVRTGDAAKPEEKP